MHVSALDSGLFSGCESPETDPPRLTRREAIERALRAARAATLCLALGTPTVLGLGGCAVRDEQARHIGALVGLDVEHGAVRSDGGGARDVRIYEVAFSDETAGDVEAQLADSPSWHELPLADAMKAALYGPADETLATLGDAQDGFARIERGYWYFENRGAGIEDTSASDAAIAQAFADAATAGLHLTIGLFDIESHTLFVYTLDSEG